MTRIQAVGRFTICCCAGLGAFALVDRFGLDPIWAGLAGGAIFVAALTLLDRPSLTR